MKQYRPATVGDAVRVANNLRPEDLQEIEGLGHGPMGVPFSVLASDVAVSFFTRKGEIAGVAGICPDPREGVGIIWMLCTPTVQEEPITFVRQAKQWLAEEQSNYRLLWNLADARNLYHHKLLKMLGFKAIQSTPTGPYNLPYLEIVKLCVYQQPELQQVQQPQAQQQPPPQQPSVSPA